jgi:hypothetical protein
VGEWKREEKEGEKVGQSTWTTGKRRRRDNAPSLLHVVVSQTRVRHRSPDTQLVPRPQVRLDGLNLLLQLALRHAVDVASPNGVHRREFEEADRFVDVRVEDFGAKLDLGERFRNADDGFELTARVRLRRSVRRGGKGDLFEDSSG